MFSPKAFEMKELAADQLMILAGSFVVYNAMSLINLSVNTVGFYQISKVTFVFSFFDACKQNGV